MKAAAPPRQASAAALQSYLDQLLQAATEPRPAAPARPAQTVPPAAPAPAAVLPVAGPRARPTAAAAGPEPAAAPATGALRPAWGRAPFSALLCRVGPLHVAVPLIKLRAVASWEGGATPIPGSPPWLRGLIRHRRCQVRLIDTQRLILPRQDPGEMDAEPGDGGHFLLVGDGSWGLACQEIGEVLALTPEQVQWRTAHGKRPWLAGTVKERLCALIDVDALPALIAPDSSGDIENVI